MQTESTVSTAENKGRKPSKAAKFSKNGDWRLFPNDSNLLQYVSTGMFYGRVKVRGKVIRKKLDTHVYTTAKLKLLDFLKNQKGDGREIKIPIPTFGEAKAIFENEIKGDPALSVKTVAYKDFNLKLISRTWVGVEVLPLDEITPTEAMEWAGRLSKLVSAEAYNHTLGVFRVIFDKGSHLYKRSGGKILENPIAGIKRLGVKPKKLQLPEPNQFLNLVKTVGEAGGGFSSRCADLIKFLAYSGCRISEAKNVTWADIDFTRNEIIVNSAKKQVTSNSSRIRRIPIISPMRELLLSIKEKYPDRSDQDSVCLVHECQKALTSACAKIKITRITHHDLRHLFATRCIEAGVDVPTVSRWLGHVDGGALAMRTYGHLRNEHSQAMAAKVKF